MFYISKYFELDYDTWWKVDIFYAIQRKKTNKISTNVSYFISDSKTTSNNLGLNSDSGIS